MPTPAARRYHRQIAAARDAAIALTAEAQRTLLALLDEWAAEIEARFAAGLSRGTDAAALREVSALIDRMTQDLAGATGDAVRLSAATVAEIQAVATAELLAAAGSTLAAGATFSGTGIRAAQAVLARPELAEAFVTLRAETAQAANLILRRGLLRGRPVSAMARELRQYIALPGSALEGDASILADRRRIGYATLRELGYEATPENLAVVRQEASRIAYRANTIARTEVMVAQAEATVQAAIDSPVVAFIHWTLSYRHREPCACEILASEDLYGHGAGLYDPRNTPVRPHPRCWCALAHILRPEAEWGAPRGEPPTLRVDLDQAAEAMEGYAPSVRAAFIGAVRTGQRATRTLVTA